MEKEKASASKWTAEMDVKLLLAYIDNVAPNTKPVNWSEIATVLGKTVEGVRYVQSGRLLSFHINPFRPLISSSHIPLPIPAETSNLT